MSQSSSRFGGYVLAAVLGVLVGGAVAVLALRAMPRMMAGRMREMMAMMRERGAALPET